MEPLRPWTENYPFTIDKTFQDKIIMPGFIDPHLHPSLPAVLSLFPFLAPESWSLPTGEFPAAATQEDYLAELKKQVEAYPQSPYYKKNIR